MNLKMYKVIFAIFSVFVILSAFCVKNLHTNCKHHFVYLHFVDIFLYTNCLHNICMTIYIFVYFVRIMRASSRLVVIS